MKAGSKIMAGKISQIGIPMILPAMVLPLLSYSKTAILC